MTEIAGGRERFVLFSVAGEHHGIGTGAVEEVVGEPLILPVPPMLAPCEGLLRWRGRLVPVIRAGSGDGIGPRGGRSGAVGSAIILRRGDVRVALTVPGPAAVGWVEPHGEGIVRREDGRLVSVLDPDDVFGAGFAAPIEEDHGMAISETSLAALPLLRFSAGGVEFSLGVEYVREVRPYESQPSPAAATGPIELAAQLGLPAQGAGGARRVVVLEVEGRSLDVIVDEVFDVFRAAPTDVLPPPNFIRGRTSPVIAALVRREGRALAILLSASELARLAEGDAGPAPENSPAGEG